MKGFKFMKKSGFTLAEVLITLGIVGVVSALVLPTFTTKMQTAKVGPRLAKAVAGFEQANIAILDDAQADALTGTTLLNSVDTYFGANGLQTHMKGSYRAPRFYSADGVSYCLSSLARTATGNGNCSGGFDTNGNNIRPHLNPVTMNTNGVLIDIDGDNGPNTLARDQFVFQMMDDGSLRPWGGSWETNNDNRWTTNCRENTTVVRPAICAGHVMENGLKVEYK